MKKICVYGVVILMVLMSGKAFAQRKCHIKGIITPQQKFKVYLLPSHDLYDRINVYENEGEQWFCSEEEARKAGFRRLPDILSTASAGTTQGGTRDTEPPEVIGTSPQNGAQDVEPSLSEISVTFNKPMMDKSWSWSYEDKTKFPEMIGEPYYTDNNTKNVLPVKLEPNKDYVIWINTTKFKNFQDTSGNPVVPYRWTFKTAQNEARDTGPPEVIGTYPQNGAQDVEPSLSEISVTFNKPMMDKSWSWSYEDKTKFPEITGDPYYTDNNTKNVLPVRLEANTEYIIWINTTKFKNFKDTSGNAVKPYRWTFKTK